MDNRKLINIFFVGQSEFNKMLSEERHKAVRQRISVSYHIDPLTEQETRQYIKHRLNVAGCKKELFKSEALHRIYSFSHGYPRLINIICDHALLTGYSGSNKVIDASVIKECEKELKIPIDQPEKQETEAEFLGPKEENPLNVLQNQSAGKRIGYFAVIILLLLATGYFLFMMQSKNEPRWKMEEIAPQSYDSPTLKAKEAFVPGVVSEADDKKDQPKIKPFDEQAIEGREITAPTQSNLQNQTGDANTIPKVKPFPDRKIIIYFKHNSNDLPDQAYDMLDRIAGFLVSNPDASINISGYTDSSGSYSYNVSVSQFRANMVKGYLVGKGVDPLKIEALGLGPKNPIANNSTEKGRQTNRRVEIELNIDQP
jgi:general secretion pathway protein A